MTTAVSKPSVRRGQYIYLKAGIYEELKEYRKGDEHFSDVVARLMRFAKRYGTVARAVLDKEFLP
jgi:predicted CopG family antitoxin